MKVPSSKFRNPKKLQIPSFKAESFRDGLELEIWNYFGSWNVELGVL